MLKQQPLITEKEGAIDYKFQGGNIEFKDMAFKHMLSAPTKGKVGDEVQRQNECLF